MSAAIVPIENTCDECRNEGKHVPMFGLYGMKKLCIDHAGARGKDEVVDITGNKKLQSPDILPPITDARTLVDTLSNVMDGLLSGKINVEKARTACQISSETVKILDLLWRIEQGKRR